MLTQGLCDKFLFGFSILRQRVLGRFGRTLVSLRLLWFLGFLDFLRLVATCSILAILGLGVRLLVDFSTLLS